MKIHSFLLILFLFVSNVSLSQNKKTENCNCKTAMDDLIYKLEQNYIGLAQMKQAGKTDEYEKRRDLYQKKVSETSPENCTAFLAGFLEYFQDGHLFVFERPNYSEKGLEEIRGMIKAGAINKDSIEKISSNDFLFNESAESNKNGWAMD